MNIFTITDNRTLDPLKQILRVFCFFKRMQLMSGFDVAYTNAKQESRIIKFIDKKYIASISF